MQILQPDDAASCCCATALDRGDATPLPVPQQLSFLSPIANATAGEPECPYADDPDYLEHRTPSVDRRCLSLVDPCREIARTLGMRNSL